MAAQLAGWMQEAGQILMHHFGKVVHPRQKEAPSSVVCDADLASEAFILSAIESRFPHHNIITEESGRRWKGSAYTWVIDPLDGTSNFVAGVPWFGVQAGVLYQGQPQCAAMYLPVLKTLYTAQAGQGALRDGQRISVTPEKDLQQVLCAFGFDPAPERRTRRMLELLFRLSAAVRNTRATNSLVDFCYTVDGRFGACVNMKTRIWDIVPVSLILPEAGGRFSDLEGKTIRFDLGPAAGEREYAVAGASDHLHGRVIAALQGRTRRPSRSRSRQANSHG